MLALCSGGKVVLTQAGALAQHCKQQQEWQGCADLLPRPEGHQNKLAKKEDCSQCAPLTAMPWSGSKATPAMHMMGQAASRTCRISASYIAGVSFVSMQDALTEVLVMKKR